MGGLRAETFALNEAVSESATEGGQERWRGFMLALGACLLAYGISGFVRARKLEKDTHRG